MFQNFYSQLNVDFTVKKAVACFSKELNQIVDTLSNRHPPKIFPTIYLSADLPSLFIKHFNDKIDKCRANFATEPFTTASTLVIWTITATFSLFEEVSQFSQRQHS